MPRGTIHPNVAVPEVQLAGADDILQRLAVDLFMRRVLEIKPEVIRDFAEHVFAVTDDTRRGRKLKHPSLEYVAWAERSQLTPDSAVFGWALRTLTGWKQHPEMRESLRWSETTLWTSCTFNDAINTEYPSNLALLSRDPAEPLEAFPDNETRSAFLERARRHWTARLEEYRATHKSMPVRTGVARHYDWLARYQVGRQSPSEIQRQDDVKKWDNVKKGIVTAARVLKITLRE